MILGSSLNLVIPDRFPAGIQIGICKNFWLPLGEISAFRDRPT